MVKGLYLTLISLCCISVNATQLTYTQNSSSAPNTFALGYPVPVPVDSQTPIDGFRSYQSLFARHQDMAISSDMIHAQIIGQTTQGENIWAYRLTDADNTTSEPMVLEGSVLQNGGIHAREWQSPEVVSGIIERFFEHQNDKGFYQYLLENSQIIIIPVLNIDGFKQTQRYPANAILSTDQDDPGNWPRDGRMRRKNMRGVDTDLSTEGDYLAGIDLNRNNSPYWATTPGRSSPRTQSIVHHGASPASEPEIKALQSAAAIADGRLRFYIDTHSFTRIYFTPMTNNTRRNLITANLASRMRAVNNNAYAYGPSSSGAGIGTTDEYFANTFQVPSYTLETEPGQSGASEYGGFGVSHDGFILPESEIARVRNELANASILGYYMQAAIPHIMQIQIFQKDSGAVVYDAKWQATSSTSRSWQALTNIPLEVSTPYQVKLSFNKTMRWRINGETAQYPGQSVNLHPSITLEGFDNNGTAYAQVISNTNGSWLNTAGAEKNNYLHYKDDSYLFEFSLAADSPAIGAKLQQLAINISDLAGQPLDTNPATIVDWQNGHWSNYEATDGTLADIGGVDRTIRLINDGSPAYTDPASSGSGGGSSGGGNSGGGNGTPPSSGSSGGGGSNSGLLFVLLLLTCANRRAVYIKTTN